MREIFLRLESENVDKRLEALDELEKLVEIADKNDVIKVLKEHILDWDEEVRLKVSYVLKLYTEK